MEIAWSADCESLIGGRENHYICVVVSAFLNKTRSLLASRSYNGVLTLINRRTGWYPQIVRTNPRSSQMSDLGVFLGEIDATRPVDRATDTDGEWMRAPTRTHDGRTEV